MISLVVCILSLLLLLLHHLVLREAHPDGLRVGHRNVVLVVLLRHLGYFFQFEVYQHFVGHFLIEILLELVLHDHVHVVGRQRALTELDLELVVEDVSW